MPDSVPLQASAYALDIGISFKHCDPAGMVFYPRYVELLNDVVEAWFAQGLGCDYQALHLRRRMAIPTVSLDCQFTRPSRLGDRLVARLRVERIGTSSVTLEHRLSDRDDPDDLRMSARHVIVFVQMDSTMPLEVPQDLAMAMRRFLVTTGVSHD